MRSYEERAKDFLKRVYPIISQYLTDPEKIEDCMDKFNEKNDRNVVVCWGSARVALITSDYVIKWEYDTEQAYFIGGFENELNLYKKHKTMVSHISLQKLHLLNIEIFPSILCPALQAEYMATHGIV